MRTSGAFWVAVCTAVVGWRWWKSWMVGRRRTPLNSRNNIHGCHECYWSTFPFKEKNKAGGFGKWASNERPCQNVFTHKPTGPSSAAELSLTARKCDWRPSPSMQCRVRISSNHPRGKMNCQQVIKTVHHTIRMLRGASLRPSKLILALISFSKSDCKETGKTAADWHAFHSSEVAAEKETPRIRGNLI